MTRSETSVAAFLRSGPSNAATPHGPSEGRTAPIPWLDLDNAGAAGSIISTAMDLTRWLRLHLHGGELEGRRLVSRRTMDEMHAPQTIVVPDRFIAMMFPEAPELTYGLGWFLHRYQGRRVIEHGGQTDGMRSTGAILPEEGLVVVVLTNEVNNLLPPALMYRIADAYLGLPPRDWSEELRRAAGGGAGGGGAPMRIQGTRPSLDLARYAGTYHHDVYGDATVRLEDGRLQLEVLGFSTPLEHWHYDTFRVVRQAPVVTMMGPLVTFLLDARAEPTRLAVRGYGDAEFRRRAGPR
jgi:CubicO group peptidase (beta-lactamase class C family)